MVSSYHRFEGSLLKSRTSLNVGVCLVRVEEAVVDPQPDQLDQQLQHLHLGPHLNQTTEVTIDSANFDLER